MTKKGELRRTKDKSERTLEVTEAIVMMTVIMNTTIIIEVTDGMPGTAHH